MWESSLRLETRSINFWCRGTRPPVNRRIYVISNDNLLWFLMLPNAVWQSLAAFSLCAEISFEHELRFLWFCLQAIAIVVKWSSVLMSSRAIKLLQPESMVKTIRQHVNGVPWRCLKKLIDSRGIIEFLSPINDLHPPTVFHHSNVLVSFHVSRSLRLVLPIHVLSPKRKKKN